MTASALPPRDLTALPVNVWFCGQEGVDTQRQDRYVPASVRAHPGKMRPALARALIENYTRPGDWILDPLSGIGTTGVEAIYLDRNYVGIELEPRFVVLQRQNLRRAKRAGATGWGVVYQGDARRLDAKDGLPQPREPEAANGPIHAVITSPPYGARLQPQNNGSRITRELLRQGRYHRGILPGIYGPGQDNLGNLDSRTQLEQMEHVYAGCYQVLRPGGLLLVVLQPGRQRQHLRALHHETARLCQELGFDFLDELVAVLGRVVAAPARTAHLIPHASFWRRLHVAQHRELGDPITLNQLEYVLVFRKPPGAGVRVPGGSGTHKSGRQAALAGPEPRPAT